MTIPVPKAKELRRVAEPLITIGKTDGVANRRLAMSRLRDKEAVGKLYNVEEFAAEIVKAAEEPAPANNTVLVGDTDYFTK